MAAPQTHTYVSTPSAERTERMLRVEAERVAREKIEAKRVILRKRLIYEGATVDELVKMLKAQPIDVRAAVATLIPVGQVEGSGTVPIYNIREAAMRILPPPDDVVSRVLAMKHTDLPKMLSKEYWQAQSYRQNYERKAGDLWDTIEVIAIASDSFKTMRMSALLLLDTIEREASLDEQQRRIVQRLIDAMLDDMRRKLVDVFEERKRSRVDSAREPEPPENDDSAWGL